VNLLVKVVEVNMVVTNNSSLEQHIVAEVLVGDETGTIVMAAKNEHLNALKPGCAIMITGGRVELFQRCMRLKVDRCGCVLPSEERINVNIENNTSKYQFKIIYEYR
jgi:replication factor A1